MRFEFDSEADALYIGINEGRVDRTIELEEGVYAGLDAGGRPLGLKFIALAAFDGWMKLSARGFFAPCAGEFSCGNLRVSPSR